jgi:hypothetical protein
MQLTTENVLRRVAVALLVGALFSAPLAGRAWGVEPDALAPDQAGSTPAPHEDANPSVSSPPDTPTTPTSSPSPSNIDAHVGSDVAGYGDSDHVYVFSPSIAGAVSNPVSGWSIRGSYLVDVVSAASVDVVSTASRRWEEVRHAGSLSGTYKPDTFGFSGHAYVSSEPDYLSLTAGASVTQDVAKKNATWLLGYDYGHDVSARTGTPWSVFSHPIDRHALKAGLTLVLDKGTVAALVVDGVLEHGDTSKPYRYIPLFAPGVSVPNGASADLVSRLRVQEKPLEQLPLTRDMLALSGQIAHRFDGWTVRGHERLYADTWGLKATSTDARLLVDWGRRLTLGPHVRFHAQTSVDFWQRAYVLAPGGGIPALRAGDRELGPLVTVTFGGSARLGLGSATKPNSWVLGLDLNGASTQYLDDLYITSRLSFVGGLSLETDL